MRKPNIIQVTAGLTLALSMGANAWYGIDQIARGGVAFILAGVWMPISIVLLERIMHSVKLGKWFGAGIVLVAVACMYYSMSHLAHLATPVNPSPKEIADGWIFAASVDLVMVLSGIALAVVNRKAREPKPAPEVIEVPVEVEKIVYVEVPAPVPAPVAEVEETETITETRQVTRTRRTSITPEQREEIAHLIKNTSLSPTQIAGQIFGPGTHPNKITRDGEFKELLALRG